MKLIYVGQVVSYNDGQEVLDVIVTGFQKVGKIVVLLLSNGVSLSLKALRACLND